jgi:hypothetical protein
MVSLSPISGENEETIPIVDKVAKTVGTKIAIKNKL